MVVFTPLLGSLALGGLQTGLGIFGALNQNAAAQQDYLNQRAFQDASTRFSTWQASFSKRVSDANSQYQYWQETVNYNQNLAYARSLQNLEFVRAINQADVVGQTRAAAGADYINKSGAIADAMAEQSMQDAVALQQYTMQALKAQASVRATGREGGSVERLVNDYARQAGDYATIADINYRLRERQYTRQQTSAIAEYLSRYNSQSFYEVQPYLEPIAPFVPLPALLTPAAPSFTGASTSSGAGALNIGSALLGGVQTGLSAYGALSSYTNSGKTGALAVNR
jgi:hypothetical protein